MVMNEMRKYVEATLEKMTPAKAQQMARSVMRGEGKEQVQRFAQDLMEWSTKSRERLTELVRSEVRSQLKSLGVATRDEVDALKTRVRLLERSAPKRSAAKRATAKRATAKRPSSGTAPTTPSSSAGTTPPGSPAAT
ncbi:MAG: phasin family protein, partial [Candidatus Velamenicoccus archaeovorus]